jgi:hypothetical protein
MEFKVMMKKACQVKDLILIFFLLLFLWWGSNAVVRYWRQPLSTDISYKYDEIKPVYQFPLLTLCNRNNFFEDTIFKECGDGSWDFIHIVVFSMKKDKTFQEAMIIHDYKKLDQFYQIQLITKNNNFLKK